MTPTPSRRLSLLVATTSLWCVHPLMSRGSRSVASVAVWGFPDASLRCPRLLPAQMNGGCLTQSQCAQLLSTEVDAAASQESQIYGSM